MLSSNDKISMRQFQVLLILDIFGAGVMSLPALAARFTQQDAWIAAGLSALIALVCVFIITSLGRRFYKYTFFDYTCKILSRPLGVAVCVLFVIKLILTASFELRIFCEIVNLEMLDRTPVYVTGALMTAVSAYAASKGYESRARLAELLFLIAFAPMLLVVIFAAKDADYSNVLPVLTTKPQDLLAGGFWSLISFTGIELCLFAPMYVNKPKELRKAAVGSVGFIGISMCFVTLVTVCAFGYSDVTRHMWPVLDMMNTISLPGSFIERQDAIVVSFWIVSIFAVLSACLFFSSLLMKDMVKKGKHSHYISIFCPVIFLISFLPENIETVYEAFYGVFLTLGVPFMLVLPFIMLVVAKVRGLGDGFEDS